MAPALHSCISCRHFSRGLLLRIMSIVSTIAMTKENKAKRMPALAKPMGCRMVFLGIQARGHLLTIYSYFDR